MVSNTFWGYSDELSKAIDEVLAFHSLYRKQAQLLRRAISWSGAKDIVCGLDGVFVEPYKGNVRFFSLSLDKQ